jgi:predicted kinase
LTKELYLSRVIGVLSGVLIHPKGRVAMETVFSEAIASEVPEDCLLISVGLPGSWKSPVTEEIARMKGLEILRSDIIRLEVLKGKDIFDEKVLDATFFTQELRSKAAELAHGASVPLIIAECTCTEEASIKRILKRTKEDYESNALTRQAYLNNKKIFEPVDIDELKRMYTDLPIIQLTIDTEFDDPPRWRVTVIKKR